MTATTLRVNEMFGPTLQGEGPSTGRPALFVRLTGCNLDCKWCDTPYTWDWDGKNGVAYDRAAETHPTPVGDVALWANRHPDTIVVITGGEPTIQGRGLVDLVDLLAHDRIEIETNGTHLPPAELLAESRVHWNVSPKLANSGVARRSAIRPFVLAGLSATGRAAFKVVADGPDDLHEILGIVDPAGIPHREVWVMPEGATPDRLDRDLAPLAEAAIGAGFNFTHRLHVLVWGDKRGH
jgi:organic radical activating enzyme